MKQDKLKLVRIGYYNHNPFPVQFTLRSGRSAPISLAADQPITQREEEGKTAGHLVKPPIEELDEEVRLGTIAYIYKDNTKHERFQDWNAKVDQKRGAVHMETSEHDEGEISASMVANNKAKPAAAPDITISSDKPPTNTASLQEEKKAQLAGAKLADSPKIGENIDDWIERCKKDGTLTMVNGQFCFDGQKFVGKKAVARYLESRSSAALQPTT